MKEYPEISVIVPVYKTEKYLSKCIDSLLAQTYKDFEIILINDGSPDSSGEICDDYACKDTRIRVIHQENKGVSSARNAGIFAAKGRYSIHIDSDDYVEENMLHDFHTIACSTKADVIISDYYVDFLNTTKYVKQKCSGSIKECIQDILTEKLHGFTWNKLIKHSLYKDHNITFPSDVNMGEDLVTVVKILYFSNSIEYLPKAYAHYVQHTDSCIATRHKTTFESQIRVVDILENFFQGNLDFTHSIRMHKVFVKKELLFYGNYPKEEVRNIYANVNKYILSYPSLSTVNKLLLWSVCLNYGNLYKCIEYLKKIKKSIYK
ncbi:glycosyltransferase [Siphonobacter sp. SORGH_AS_1065]|uniref:glycosyltransferase family 2 protein n=1 Tax=Siphonobacter sp. SORGH_AS_1065 TaxID=3041795 RepID=UPI00277F8FEE|nr:glycosyltransferase [Siphonobacter sp. SORGH_AS_1065]MDQ1086638.1 glycosyltransferase involved in cell wall biosynthesis [Siphonobacter sp. SORGH_AS_1065]